MAIKVLMVLDGDYRFMTDGPTKDFTYTVLFGAIDGEPDIEVTKAHRQTDPDATHNNFDFAAHNLLQYDVIWLLGHDGRNDPPGSTSPSAAGLADAQVAAIARFMDAGGGVFATGDHDSIGCVMCGKIPRVRAMRGWYGEGDGTSPMPAGFPRNYPRTSSGRADTTQRNPGGDYQGNANLVWFENQSDSVPQPIVPVPPTHPILRRGAADIVVYPDHMHEGRTLGQDPGYNYGLVLDFAGQSFTEFPEIPGEPRETPKVIANGQSLAHSQKYAFSGSDLDTAIAGTGPVAALSVYEGRQAGVGRIVTGSTFHHYIDINLTGDFRIDTPGKSALVGPNAEKNHGLKDAAAAFADIKAVYVNITRWLARPKPRMELILERSTFSQDEALAIVDFADSILVTVDGLRPNQFPGPNGIESLDPMLFDPTWAPTITPADPTGLAITATSVTSDDPGLPQRLQRFTFRYKVHLDNSAFGFGTPAKPVRVDAALASPALAAPLADSAWIQLVKAANPFMLDLANDNQTVWLSSDLRVFRAVAGQNTLGKMLPAGASRTQALQYLRDVLQDMTVPQFENDLSITQSGSALSPFATTTENPKKNVYNFAVARVRLQNAAAKADKVRVFFRIVPSPTTALLTYLESPPGTPIGSYRDTGGADPIAIPGTDAGMTEWLSFPVFLHERMDPPATQVDGDNVKPIPATVAQTSTFFGALVDNNLDDVYLPLNPGPGAKKKLPDLMMGEHQCLVAQIAYAPAPIPNNARPSTSDKLAQRNLAFSAVANPGLDASRMAVHTFEIAAAPGPIADDLPPDELLLDWGRTQPPDGTEVRLEIPSWSSADVIALADRFYPRHELRAHDPHTVAVPGGGTRYVPVPRSFDRQAGVIVAEFPLGVKRGERFDLSVRQVSSRARQADIPPPRVTKISLAEAAELIAGLAGPAAPNIAGAAAPPAEERGAFDLGGNRTLVTDLSVFDAASDHAEIIEHPDPEIVAAALADSGRWRETIGAFQLAIPVDDKAGMLAHHLRLLSVLRWRAQWLRPNGRWYAAFNRYVALIADKVRALGGDPWAVPPTPDGDVPLPGDGGGDPWAGGDGGADAGWKRHKWLLLLLLLIAFLLGAILMRLLM